MNRLILGAASNICDTITFKDCTWTNITPTYRTGDVVIETTKTTTIN
jgi:hypothetical protein